MNSYRHIDRWNYIVDGMEKMELWISCMDGWVGGIRCIKGRQTNRQTDRQTDTYIDRQIRWMDGWMDGWIDKQIDTVDGQIYRWLQSMTP